MARKTTIINLQVDTEPVEDAVGDMSVILAGLEKAVKGVQVQLDKTFGGSAADMDRFSRSLADVLAELRTDLGKLKTATAEAAAPIGAVLVPVLDKAVKGATRLVESIGLVMGALLGTETVTESADGAAEAEKRLESAAASAAKAAKRSLASFDQINRLEGASSVGSSTTGVSNSVQVLPETVTDTLSPQLQAVVEKILALVEPVRNIDFSALTQSLGQLGSVLGELGGIIGQQLEWVWFNVLVPLGTWVVEEAAPVTVDTLTAAVEALGQALQPVLVGIQAMQPYLEPVIGFIGDTVIKTLEALKEQFQKVGQTFAEKGQKIQEIFLGIGQIVAVVWQEMEPILTEMKDTWSAVLDYLGSKVSRVIGTVTDIFHGLVGFVAGVMTGDWERAWEGLKEIFHGSVNGIIGGLNAMIAGVVGGLNGLIGALNKLSFTLPDWDVFGSLAGKQFGLNLPTITAPQIPYLAKGAVLPANRPFLAVVGDQKHGTNVEAPLSTIQEAVAVVMEDMVASNLAGQEAIVGVLRELLDAVLGIRVGDEVIGRAVQRYNRKMAVVKGGNV